MGSRELLTQLRRRLADERYTLEAFTITAIDRMATDVVLDVRAGRLRTDVENGSSAAVNLNLDLADSRYDQLGKLVDQLQSRYGKQYTVTAADGMLYGHPSLDLENVTSVPIKGDVVTLRTHRWSDEELLRFIDSGARRHNPSYSVDNLPASERDMVMSLAHVEALRALAADASKRRGLEATAESLLSIAAQTEQAYERDYKRVAKARVPIRTDDDGVREGDVVVGHFSRMSLRTGFQAPGVANVPPQAPLLHDVEDRDASDFALTLRWRRTRETDVYTLELWRDTHADVVRSRDVDTYPTSAVCVWRSLNRAQKDQEGFGTVDLAGELVSTFVDGFIVPPATQTITDEPDALEPGTTYWYRLYVCDKNGEYAASDAVQATTKAERALFSRVAGTPALSVMTGVRAGGTALTITGTKFQSNTPRVLIGTKEATSVVVVSDTSITCVVPGVHAWTPEYADVTLVSLSGLRDVYPRGWRYT